MGERKGVEGRRISRGMFGRVGARGYFEWNDITLSESWNVINAVG